MEVIEANKDYGLWKDAQRLLADDTVKPATTPAR